jgi:pyruvate/2-oxoglutarate dehydrogenase complex dihydrolipoamide acyltransferase (E2) component
MTNHVVRLYAFAGSVLVLFLTWATIAAKPWASHAAPKADPRWAALAAREHGLRKESLVVQRVVAGRWHVYRIRLAARQRVISAAVKRHQQQLAAARAAAAVAVTASSTPSYSAPSSSGYSAPAVRVVTLPPVTITRTS